MSSGLLTKFMYDIVSDLGTFNMVIELVTPLPANEDDVVDPFGLDLPISPLFIALGLIAVPMVRRRLK